MLDSGVYDNYSDSCPSSEVDNDDSQKLKNEPSTKTKNFNSNLDNPENWSLIAEQTLKRIKESYDDLRRGDKDNSDANLESLTGRFNKASRLSKSFYFGSRGFKELSTPLSRKNRKNIFSLSGLDLDSRTIERLSELHLNKKDWHNKDDLVESLKRLFDSHIANKYGSVSGSLCSNASSEFLSSFDDGGSSGGDRSGSQAETSDVLSDGGSDYVDDEERGLSFICDESVDNSFEGQPSTIKGQAKDLSNEVSVDLDYDAGALVIKSNDISVGLEGGTCAINESDLLLSGDNNNNNKNNYNDNNNNDNNIDDASEILSTLSNITARISEILADKSYRDEAVIAATAAAATTTTTFADVVDTSTIVTATNAATSPSTTTTYVESHGVRNSLSTTNSSSTVSNDEAPTSTTTAASTITTTATTTRIISDINGLANTNNSNDNKVKTVKTTTSTVSAASKRYETLKKLVSEAQLEYNDDDHDTSNNFDNSNNNNNIFFNAIYATKYNNNNIETRAKTSKQIFPHKPLKKHHYLSAAESKNSLQPSSSSSLPSEFNTISSSYLDTDDGDQKSLSTLSQTTSNSCESSKSSLHPLPALNVSPSSLGEKYGGKVFVAATKSSLSVPFAATKAATTTSFQPAKSTCFNYEEALVKLNSTHLQIIMNSMLDNINAMNEELMDLLQLRDEHLIVQDSLLVDIEDYTRMAEEYEYKKLMEKKN
ncbi:hypothetical protein HELRODRAFT_177785 [Helobdella robusta]|uniref:Schwannomin interacting protein 1 C-terminal domain-containing protein n=1 Tax=Helobdella robusta TaxID=6412 RepID=T1FC95_HELRO|nr:hypothetical protein HELRODRAFT_177785 [Helobdella robusta]ESN97725.1 hypothetical protein HELRODRAFT_177785 [Helobdella robusta]